MPQSSPSPNRVMSLFELHCFLWALPKELRIEVMCYFPLHYLLALSDSPLYGDDSHRILLARVKDVLHEFGLDEDATLEMMENTQSGFSGSSALYVAYPGQWWPGDVDFYCPRGLKAELLQFFISQQYELASSTETPISPTSDDPGTSPSLPHAHDDHDDIRNNEGSTTHPSNASLDSPSNIGIPIAVTVPLNPQTPGASTEYGPQGCMLSVETMTKGDKKINIIESEALTAVAPLFFFYSTAVMNMVTAQGVICYYPELTFHNITVENHTASMRDATRRAGALQKYRDRGFTVHHDCSTTHIGRGTEPVSCRVCQNDFMHWDDAMSMPFRKGEDLEPNHQYHWRLAFRRERQGGGPSVLTQAHIFVEDDPRKNSHTIYEGDEGLSHQVGNEDKEFVFN